MSWHSGLQVRVLEGPDSGAVTPLDKPKMTIGRARASGSRVDGWVLLFDKSVSRRHAEFAWNHREKHYVLKHVSKTNFTWVDDIPLEAEIVAEIGRVVQMGGSRMIIEAFNEAETQPEVTARNSGSVVDSVEATHKLNQPVRAVALRETEAPRLVVLRGGDAGFAESLRGLYITIGRGNFPATQLFEDEKTQPFDQVVELSAPQIHPNHLLLRWDELRQGYSAFKNPSVPDPIVKRLADGMDWKAPLTNSGGLVRAGDRVFFAETEILIEEAKDKDANSSISPLSLSPSGS